MKTLPIVEKKVRDGDELKISPAMIYFNGDFPGIAAHYPVHNVLIKFSLQRWCPV